MAQTDACKVEHVLSANTMGRLASFVEFITEAPHRPEWLEHYFDYHEHGRRLYDQGDILLPISQPIAG